MEDDAKDMSLTGAKTTHSVAKIDPIDASRPLNGPMMYGERDRIALTERNYLGPGLHARSLFREHELAACEVPARLRKQDRHLNRKYVLAI